MKKLPNNFKPAIDKIGVLDGWGDISTYQNANKLYNDVNRILTDSGCEFYDMNNVIHKYRAENEVLPVVKNLKKLMRSRNKELYQQAVRSAEWKLCLGKLKKLANDRLDRYVHTKEVERALVKTLTPYADHWLGFWTAFTTDEEGNISSIELFDRDDIESFLDELRQQD